MLLKKECKVFYVTGKKTQKNKKQKKTVERLGYIPRVQQRLPKE